MLQSHTLLNTAHRNQAAQHENTAKHLEERNARFKEVQGDLKKLEDKYKKLKAEAEELRSFKKKATTELKAKEALEAEHADLTANYKSIAAGQYFESFKCCLTQLIHLQPDFDTSPMGLCKKVTDGQIEGSDDEHDVRLLLQPASMAENADEDEELEADAPVEQEGEEDHGKAADQQIQDDGVGGDEDA